MRVVSWNVNGLRASVRNSGKDLKGLLDSLGADIICFQETKATREQLDVPTYSADGYNGYFSFCKTRAGYSGVVTFCRDSATPCAAEEGLTGVLAAERKDTVKCYSSLNDYTEKELVSLDAEGRSVITEHLVCDDNQRDRNLVVINVYCPMVDSTAEDQTRMDYKLKFYAALEERCRAMEKEGKSVLVVGDLNCTMEVKDSAYLQEDPAMFDGNHPARKWMRDFVSSNPDNSEQSSRDQSCLLLDTFRCLHPNEEKSFTCWSTLLDCRKTNYGTRIDYILCSRALVGTLRTAEVWQHVQGSDHCPVFAEFDFVLVSSKNQPSLSSTYFSFGTQKKLSDFLLRSSSGSQSVSKEIGGLKRTVSKDTQPPPTKARKLSSDKTTSRGSSSQTLLTFMKPKTTTPALYKESRQSDPTSGGVSASKDVEPTQGLSQSGNSQKGNSSGDKELSQSWKSVFTGPPKPPLCNGHNEPCVLRTVKKQGPNLNKRFWVCSKPHGSKDDPTSRCDFFVWAKKK